MDADRERDVAEVARPNADAGKRTSPGQLRVPCVVLGSRVKNRLPGRAPRAPILGDFGLRNDAEIFKELGVRELAKGILVEDRDPFPHVILVELVDIDAVELATIPRYILRELEGV